MKTIIIEDQQYPLEALERAVKAVGISQYDVAHHYVQARNFILKNTYDLVLLDHRMPYGDPGNLEQEDFSRFSDSLADLGYTLIPEIRVRMPTAVIVGTSSERNPRNLPCPDYKMRKTFEEAGGDLREILQSISQPNF